MSLEMSVDGKVIAISGVSSGIGRAAARALAGSGAFVVGIARRQERVAEIAQALRDDGHQMTPVVGDVTQPEDCKRFVETAVSEHGRLDALINNVGGPGVPTYVPFEKVSPEDFDNLVALNLKSAFFCAQAAIPHMRRQGQGSIVNVSSVVGTQAMALQPVYAPAKAALDHLSRCLAIEYLNDGIRVNTLVIGGAMTGQSARALTEMAAALDTPPPTAETLPASVQGTPMDEIVDALTFLCSDQSRGINAAAITVDQARSAGAVFSAALMDALTGKWTR
jgi:NAD(P)-dependent dehydrogenase (short-subunit alcohol dehydrogenase family)